MAICCLTFFSRIPTTSFTESRAFLHKIKTHKTRQTGQAGPAGGRGFYCKAGCLRCYMQQCCSFSGDSLSSALGQPLHPAMSGRPLAGSSVLLKPQSSHTTCQQSSKYTWSKVSDLKLWERKEQRTHRPFFLLKGHFFFPVGRKHRGSIVFQH